MDYVTFGRTGLTVSAAGLGTGGSSRIGLGTGSDDDQAIAVIHRALELGITYFDSAEGYGTEEVLGRGLEGHRDEVVISTKAYASNHEDGSLHDAKTIRIAVEEALRRLRTEHIDVFHLHRVTADEYDYSVAELVPALAQMRDDGLIGYLGVSESTSGDGEHLALQRVVADDCWDVLMTGFNFFNQGARETVFPQSIAKNIAVEIMGSARGPYSRPAVLRELVGTLVESGQLAPEGIDLDDPLGFLIGPDGAADLAEAAYRFTRYEPGVHVVLIGTGSVAHLEDNVRSLHNGPLPADALAHLARLFGALRVTRS
jgi:L-galactose dehydrogenase